jgi:hypothetical protein
LGYGADSIMTRLYRDKALLQIQLFLDRYAYSAAEQLILSCFLKTPNISDRLARVTVTYIYDKRSHLPDLGIRETFADGLVIGFWQERFGQGDTPGSF